MPKITREVNVKLKLYLQEFNNNIREADRQINMVYKSLKLASAEFKNNGDQVKYLETRLDGMNKIQEITSKKIVDTEEALAKAKKELGENSKTVNDLEKELMDLRIAHERNATQLKALSKEFELAKNSMVQFGKGAIEAGKNLDEIGNKIQDVGKSMMIVSAGITAAMVGIVNSAIDFESAFAGVAKTFPGTEEKLNKLRVEIREMALEIPATTTELSAVAEAAGQLGIHEDNIASFTKTMTNLGVATNLSAEEAATVLARFKNITGMNESDFDKLASSIVELGNNFATTERDIAAMALNLAAAGKQVGLTESEILAISATLSSLGLEAQAGGTAFSKLMLRMQVAVETGNSDLQHFADIAKTSAEGFSEAFANDATGALNSFLEGLGNTEEVGASAIVMLDEMGISEVRLRDAILRTSGATEMFNDALDASSSAWNKNTALSEEAEKRYETTESKMQILKNTLNEVGISFGELLLPAIQEVLESLKGFLTSIKNMNPETKKTILIIAGVVAAIGPAVFAIGTIIKVVAALTTAVGYMTTFIGGGTAALTALGGTAATIVKVMSALASPITLIVIAIAALVAAVVYLWNTNDEFKENIILIWNSIAEAIGPIISVIQAIIGVFISWIQTGVESIMGVLQGLITFLAGVFTGDWGKAWDGLKMIALNIINAVIGFFEGMVNGFINGLNAMIRVANKIPGVNMEEINHVDWKIKLDASDTSGQSIGRVNMTINATVREEADVDRLTTEINRNLGLGII